MGAIQVRHGPKWKKTHRPDSFRKSGLFHVTAQHLNYCGLLSWVGVAGTLAATEAGTSDLIFTVARIRSI
jgi:hypothetical protein